MFSFSRALIRVASLYRGGGWVKCWVASSACRSSVWPDGERRQEFVLDFAAGRPDPAVAVELEHLALGLEQPRTGGDAHVGHGEDGGRHLAGDESCVDQLVEPELVVAELALDLLGRQLQVGGPDGLVGLLRVLAGGIADRLGRQVLLAVLGLRSGRAPIASLRRETLRLSVRM